MLSTATRHRYQTLLDSAILTAADECPGIIFVATEKEPVVISRRCFRRQIQSRAAALRELGLQPRDLIVIAHDQSLESIYAFWAAMLLGAIPSMFPTLTEKLDPDVYMSSVAELVRLSDVAAVLTNDDFALALRSRLPCPVYSATDLIASRRPDEQPSDDAAPPALTTALPGEIAFLQHSSGTTGLQKGVALSHAAVLNQLAAYSDAIALSEEDVVVSWLPLYHDMGLIAGFLLPLIQGIPLVLMSPFDWVSHPALLFRAIHAHGGTLCWLPNFAYNHCARRIRRRDSDGLSAASMRLFVNCSEPVRHDSHQLFLERFTANGVRPEMLGVSYAMAENTFAVTQTAPGRPARTDRIDGRRLEQSQLAEPVSENHPEAQMRVSCGPPIPGTEARIVDAQGLSLADRQVGEIAIRSDCLLTGYYHRPDLQPFASDGWYLTGDMGYLPGVSCMLSAGARI